MQVMKLGVLRVVAQKVPALLKALCKGGLARYGSVAKTIVAMNERIRHFGRLIMASLVAPGYVVASLLCDAWFRCMLSTDGLSLSMNSLLTRPSTCLAILPHVDFSSLCCRITTNRYLVRKGVTQATLKGRQWRHGIVVWAFMVAGLIGRRLPGSRDPCFVSQRKGRRHAAGPRAGRRGTSSGGTPGNATGGSHDDYLEDNSAADSEASLPDRGSRATSDVGTDDTMSGGEERVEDVPVQEAAETSEAYKELFGDRPMHEAVLYVVCLAARLMGKLCGDNEPENERFTDDSALALQKEAYDFVCRYVAVLFGPIHTTKMHALAFHLVDEIFNRGNLVEADTSVNEALHRLLKAMFEGTNKQTTSFAVQMLRCEQTLAHIVAEDANDKARAAVGLSPRLHDVAFRPDVSVSATDTAPDLDGLRRPEGSEHSSASGDGRRDDESDDGSYDEHPAKRSRRLAGSERRRRRRRARVRGRRVAVADLIVKDGGRLKEITSLLGVNDKQHLTVANSQKFEAVLGWRHTRLDQHIRAADDLYRKSWYDFILYRDAAFPGVPQLGPARLIVRAVDGERRDTIIVQRMEPAQQRQNCILTEFGCRRHKWIINAHTGFPALAAVNVVDVERLEHVVPDFEDLCERHGLRGTPATIPDTPTERLRQRYFTNIFFPWTSNSIDELPGDGQS